MAFDPSRLKTQLLNTGLSVKDQPQYQLLNSMIDFISSLTVSVTNITNNTSSVITNNISQFSTLMEDFSAFDDGLISSPYANLGSAVSGSGTATQVTFWNTSSSLSGDAGLTWDNTNKILNTNSIKFPTNVSYPGAGSISKLSNNGLMVGSVTGSLFDFALVNPSGANGIIVVPTGTLDVQLGGSLTATSFISSTTTASVFFSDVADNNKRYLRLGNTGATLYLGVASSTGADFSLGNFAGLVVQQSSAGLSIAATNASGDIRFYSGGTSERMRLFADGALALGNTTDNGAGSFTMGVSGTQPTLQLLGSNFGSAGLFGALVDIQANTNGAGAPGVLSIRDKNNTQRNFFCDTDPILRFNGTPTVTAGDQVGTVVLCARGYTRQTGKTTTTSFTLLTVPAFDCSYYVSLNIIATAFTSGVITANINWTDETGTARTISYNDGGLGLVITTVNHVRTQASTTITISTTGVFTATYNIEGCAVRIQ